MKTLLEYPILNAYRSHVPAGFYAERGHTGEDYKVAANTELPCPLTGTIIAQIKQVEMGWCVYLRHDATGHVWVFAHCNKFVRKVGDRINRGEVFLVTGTTGTKVKGAHVHVECITPGPMNLEDKVMLRPELRVPFNGKGYNTRPSTMLRHLYLQSSVDPITLKSTTPNVAHNPHGF